MIILYFTIVCNNIDYLRIDICKRLIGANGGGINVRDNDGNTPLHYTLCEFYPNAEDRDIAVLTHLLTRDGVDVSIKHANTS